MVDAVNKKWMMVLESIESFSSSQNTEAKPKTMPRSPARQMDKKFAAKTDLELSIKLGFAREKSPSAKI